MRQQQQSFLMLLPHFTLVLPWQEWQDKDPTENALEGPTLWLLIYGDPKSWEQPLTWSGNATHCPDTQLSAPLPRAMPPVLPQLLLGRRCQSVLAFPVLLDGSDARMQIRMAFECPVHPLAPCPSATSGHISHS